MPGKRQNLRHYEYCKSAASNWKSRIFLTSLPWTMRRSWRGCDRRSGKLKVVYLLVVKKNKKSASNLPWLTLESFAHPHNPTPLKKKWYLLNMFKKLQKLSTYFCFALMSIAYITAVVLSFLDYASFCVYIGFIMSILGKISNICNASMICTLLFLNIYTHCFCFFKPFHNITTYLTMN